MMKKVKQDDLDAAFSTTKRNQECPAPFVLVAPACVRMSL